MKTTSITFALCALLLTGACSKHETTATAGSAGVTNDTPVATQQQNNLSPEELGVLGAQIQKNPKDAQRLLTEKGLNEKTFEQAIRKVSEDPAASRRYADSFRKASA